MEAGPNHTKPKYPSMFNPRTPIKFSNEYETNWNIMEEDKKQKISDCETPIDLYRLLYKKDLEQVMPSDFVLHINQWSNRATETSIQHIIDKFIDKIMFLNPEQFRTMFYNEIVVWCKNYRDRVDAVKRFGIIESTPPTDFVSEDYPDFTIDRLDNCKTMKQLFHLMFKNSTQETYDYFSNAFNNWIEENDIHTLDKFLSEQVKHIKYDGKKLKEFDVYTFIKKWCINYRFDHKNEKEVESKEKEFLNQFKTDSFIISPFNKDFPEMSEIFTTTELDNRIQQIREYPWKSTMINKLGSNSESMKIDQKGAEKDLTVKNVKLYQCTLKCSQSGDTRVLIVEATGLADLELKTDRYIASLLYDQNSSLQNVSNGNGGDLKSLQNSSTNNVSNKNEILSNKNENGDLIFPKNHRSKSLTEKIKNEIPLIEIGMNSYKLFNFSVVEIVVFAVEEEYKIEENLRIWRKL